MTARREHRKRKLPVQQLTILAICRFAEPIALTSVNPYLPEMIESLRVPKDEVAKWAGIASAVFSFAQCLTGILWGLASDKFGRKPIILFGLTNTMLMILLWGFSTSLPMAIAVRAISGAGNGNVGIIRTAVAEMVPWKELQPRAFSIMPLVFNIGSVFGPALGGALANPYHRHPSDPPGSALLDQFPYALPNIVAASIFLIGITTGILFLREPLETCSSRRDYGLIIGKKITGAAKRQYINIKTWWRQRRGEEAEPLLKPSSASTCASTAADEESPRKSSIRHRTRPPKPRLRDVASKQSALNLLSYSLLALHALGYDQLLPIFMHHPPQSPDSTPSIHLPFKFAGGFGIDSPRIGLLFTLYGVSGMLGQFLIFPPLARRFGVLNCLKAVTCIFPLVYLVTPFTALLPTALEQQIAIFALMLGKGWASIFAFPCSTIMLTNSASSLSVLGTLNGMATSFSAIGRATGPFIGGIVFKEGVRRGYVIAPWFVFAAISILAAVPVFFLVEGEGFGGDSDGESGEDRDEDEDDEDGGVPGEDTEEEEDEGETGYGFPPPLLGRHTTASPSTPSSPPTRPRAPTAIDEHALSMSPQSAGLHHGPRSTSAGPRRPNRRLSMPIGMGQGISRRLSSNLGQSLGSGGSYGG